MKRTHNPLTAWIHEFQSHQSLAKPLEGWRCLTQTAELFPRVVDWLIGFDMGSQEVIYRRSAMRPEQRLGKASFDQQFFRIRQARKLSEVAPSMAE